MMTDKEIERFMELFRWYRDEDKLPPKEHQEFKELSRKYQEMKKRDEKR
jgi:hypothetical protein